MRAMTSLLSLNSLHTLLLTLALAEAPSCRAMWLHRRLGPCTTGQTDTNELTVADSMACISRQHANTFGKSELQQRLVEFGQIVVEFLDGGVCRSLSLKDWGNVTNVTVSLDAADEHDGCLAEFFVDEAVSERAGGVYKLKFVSCGQSSLWTSTSVCSKAKDGNRNGVFQFCFNTANNGEQWWQAELAARSLIAGLRIHNRADCCSERLDRFRILVDFVECYRRDRPGEGFNVLDAECWAIGTTVRLEKLNNYYFALCELEAYGREV